MGAKGRALKSYLTGENLPHPGAASPLSPLWGTVVGVALPQLQFHFFFMQPPVLHLKPDCKSLRDMMFHMLFPHLSRFFRLHSVGYSGWCRDPTEATRIGG